MKNGFFRTLAWMGIKKNKKLYLPYILTCMGMVMMCYIISFLSLSPTFKNMSGGSTAQIYLGVGFSVLCVFSLIFLFYTNSFLIRRRRKELGLYNILGLDKKNIAAVLFWETLISAVISLTGGLTFGILFSKFSELAMVKVLGGTTGFAFTIGIESIFRTALLFLGIFAVIYISSILKIHLTNPIELLKSENTGEKPPKANWFLAILGVVLLAYAYYLAVTIEDPVTALYLFFVAVIMVVIATYMLFVSGSVTLCRILQKNKRYYYKTNHFVSVSSMAYRMKRNGAGLASICILCTAVLVMVSSTICLYIGAEDSLRTRYPRNINLDAVVSNVDLLSGEQTVKVQELTDKIVEQNGAQKENILQYRTAAFGGMLIENRIIFDNSVYEGSLENMSDIWQVFIVPVSDYNSLMNKEESLSAGEVIIYTTKEIEYEYDTIQIGDTEPLKIKKKADDFVANGIDAMQIFPTMYLFVENINEIIEPIKEYTLEDNGIGLVSLHWLYGFDLSCDEKTQIAILDQISQQISLIEKQSDEFSFFHVLAEGSAKERDGFYARYGGMFFLGILLGFVFITAAVLIIYYKQVCEGYEDQSRFEIMQKVGMTKKEIKSSVNSQILTVFFMPLITAGIHLAFAFPLIKKLMLLFNLTNISLLAMVTAVCYIVFAVFYVLVYKITSHSYFSIVSGGRNE